MKLTDARWDTRNLGVKCAEINFEPEDTIENLSDALEWSSPFDYITAKVPSGMVELSLELQQRGFSYIESLFGVSIDLSKTTVPPFVGRREGLFTCKLADGQSRERVFSEIAKGVFDTDRVALDPAFGIHASAKRYINWIRDEMNRGAFLYHVLYKDEEIAFFTMKEIIPAVECYPFLTGLYSSWRESGLGTNATVLMAMREARRLGYRRIRTHISSNNLPIVRMHELLGYRIDAIDQVFIRHNRA